MKALHSTLFGIGAMALSLAAQADRPDYGNGYDHQVRHSTTTATLVGLGCSAASAPGAFLANSWALGASSPASSSGGGSGAGKVSFSVLSVAKNFDACSPALMNAVAMGRHFATLTLVQQDANGNVVMTVDLRDVIVTSWNIGASKGELPQETVGFDYSQVAIADGSGNRSCWDIKLNRAC